MQLFVISTSPNDISTYKSVYISSLLIQNLIPYEFYYQQLVSYSSKVDKQKLINLLETIKPYCNGIQFYLKEKVNSSNINIFKIISYCNKHEDSTLIQFLVMSQFFLDSNSNNSLFKSFQLYSTQLINKDISIKWINSLLPNLEKFIIEIFEDYSFKDFNPYFIYQYIKEHYLEDQQKYIFGPNLINSIIQFQNYKDFNLINDLYKKENNNFSDEKLIKMVLEYQSQFYFETIKDCIKYNHTLVFSNTLKNAIINLYGNFEKFSNLENLGSFLQILLTKSKNLGLKAHNKLIEYYEQCMINFDLYSTSYRKILIEKKKISFILKDLYYNSFYFQILEIELFNHFINIINEISINSLKSNDLFELLPCLNNNDIYYLTYNQIYSLKCILNLYQLIEKFNINKEIINNFENLIFNSTFPFNCFNNNQLVHLDIFIKGIFKINYNISNINPKKPILIMKNSNYPFIYKVIRTPTEFVIKSIINSQWDFND